MGRSLMSEDRRVRVLVVDDDSDLVESYRHVLELAGYDVSTALSGQAALGEARAARPDVVLTDVSMPLMDGFELINRLKGEMNSETPPVVVCSAFDVTEKEALSRGAQLFLRKPASADTLVRSIEALRRGSQPDADQILAEQEHVKHERICCDRGSAVRLGGVDRAAVARTAQPWLEWLRRYFDCASAGLFLLEGGVVRPVVVVGPQLAHRPEPRLLHVALAAGVETGTSLVVSDMATHPTFRKAAGPRTDISSFAGVPLITSDGFRVGALCIADARPGRFDAEALTMMEFLGRRGVSGLFENGVPPARDMSSHVPLLTRRTFETLLASELKIARRAAESVEVMIGDLAPGVSAGACAARVWKTGARARLAIGAMGPGRVGIFMRGAPTDAREHVASCLKRARAQGLLDAAGVAAVMASTSLSEAVVVELAESALSVAESAAVGTKVERVVIRTESGRYLA